MSSPRARAAAYSFLMAIPVILGGAVLELVRHPLLAAERDARSAALQAIRQLALPVPVEVNDDA